MGRATRELDVLNELLEVTLDTVAGYREAAAKSDDQHLQHCLLRRADERQHIAERLSMVVERLGGDPPAQSNPLDVAHRAFLSMRSRRAASDSVVLREMVRGEQFLRCCYEDVLHDNVLSPRAHDAVRNAYGSVWAGEQG